MSEEATVVLSRKDPKVEIGVNELASLLKSIQESSDAKLAAALEKFGDSLKEINKPYIDPKQAENDAAMRESMKHQREVQIQALRDSQVWCEHLQGSNALSKIPGNMTCIVRHRLDTGEIIGICTNCQRVFREGEEDYNKQMRRASGNELSSAGQRSFLDPTSVKRAGR